MTTTFPTFSRGVLTLLLGLSVFTAILSGPALYLAIVAAALTLGWNLVAVTLFACAPCSFWQALALLLVYRVATARFRRN